MSDAQPLWPASIRPVRIGGLSGRIEIRALLWSIVFLLLAIAVGVWSLTVGRAALGFDELAQAIQGQLSVGDTRVLFEYRLPRVIFALLGGAALAVSGAVFQSITRNPLGSPDIIGFSTGAYTGTLLVGTLIGQSALGTALGALGGGLATGAIVYLLAYRRGVSGMRIIVVGLGVSLFLGAVNTWLLTTVGKEQAISAASWGAGSLNDIAWAHVIPLAIALVIALPIALLIAPDLRVLELGDDAGRGLGASAERVRIIMLAVGIGLVAAVTASAGPIAFVALSAPQLAMRITRTPGVRILPAATLGALLLVFSDFLARTIVPEAQLPVGVVTLCLGGAYLVWLLAAPGRKG